MITRKAITTAFEVMAERGSDVPEVLVFCFKNGTPIEKVCVVRVTRDMEFPDRYTVVCGLCSKGEREWFWEETQLKGSSPKLHIRDWLYWKEKRALARRRKQEKHAK